MGALAEGQREGVGRLGRRVSSPSTVHWGRSGGRHKNRPSRKPVRRPRPKGVTREGTYGSTRAGRRSVGCSGSSHWRLRSGLRSL